MLEIDSIKPGTVNVLIGPNGSGKSQMLRQLCLDFLNNGDRVLAIAPTIYDRFHSMPKAGNRFIYFGARQGRKAANYVIRNALQRASSEDPLILKKLTQALAYTDFDPVVGIALSDSDSLSAYGRGVSDEYLFNTLASKGDLSKKELFEFESILLKWMSLSDSERIVRLKLEDRSFNELDTLSFIRLIKYEQILKKVKPSFRFHYFLYRHGKPIPLLEACSGEICFITTIAFIATQLQPRAVIAIDEPDTSLHPTWQQSYVKTLLDLFSYYEPRILISTHSPIIISGAEAANGVVSVFEMKNGEANFFKHAKLSLEEMYDRLFGLITPNNHYLSKRAVTMLNALNAGEQTLGDVILGLETLRAKSYDDSQRKVISKFEEMARRLDTMKQGGSK